MPDVSPCVVTVTADVLSYLDAARQLVDAPVVGGFVVAHATVRFERYPDDRRGAPCDTPDRQAATCKGRKSAPAAGPEWWTDGAPFVPLEGGWLVRVGPLSGATTFGTLWRANWMDQGTPPRSLVRCAQAPDENDVTHSRVTVTP